MKPTNKQMCPALPISLKKKVIHNILIRSIVCLLLLTLFIFIIIMWGNKLFPITFDYRKGYTGLRILCYVLFLCVPFLVTGIPLKLIDKSWSGTITRVEIKENLGTTSNPHYVYVYPKQDLILTIRREDGKEIQKTVLSLVEKIEPGIDSSHIGKTFYQSHKYNIVIEYISITVSSICI